MLWAIFMLLLEFLALDGVFVFGSIALACGLIIKFSFELLLLSGIAKFGVYVAGLGLVLMFLNCIANAWFNGLNGW